MHAYCTWCRVRTSHTGQAHSLMRNAAANFATFKWDHVELDESVLRLLNLAVRSVVMFVFGTVVFMEYFHSLSVLL